MTSISVVSNNLILKLNIRESNKPFEWALFSFTETIDNDSSMLYMPKTMIKK